jgi:hypothetical protein
VKQIGSRIFRGAMFGTLMLATPLPAAPLAQINCVYDSVAEGDRESFGRDLFAAMYDSAAPLALAHGSKAQAAIIANAAVCKTQNSWTADEAAAATTHTMLRLLAGATQNIIKNLGGDPAAADLFFAQNKYKILDENAAGNSSEEWARTRLVEMGFASPKSKAFEVVWLYLGFLFQQDDEADNFVNNRAVDRRTGP